MWRCGNCGAPNPHTVNTCYNCKVDRNVIANSGSSSTSANPNINQSAASPQSQVHMVQAQSSQSATAAPPAPCAGSNVKQCPYCGADIADHVLKCMHCGEWLSNADSPDAPPSTGQQVAAVMIALFCWFFGIILGCYFLLGNRKRLGKFYLQCALVGLLLWILLWIISMVLSDSSKYTLIKLIVSHSVQ